MKEKRERLKSLMLHGREISNVFQLIGYKENDITYSTGWVFSKCGAMLEILIKEQCGVASINQDDIEIKLQEFDKNSGITDIEITDNKEFHIIIEAKRGWMLPSENQLLKYSNRGTFAKNNVRFKIICTLSECSREYALHNLTIKNANGIPIKHISWKDIYRYTEIAYANVSNSEKKLLKELQLYLRGLMSMQNISSNEVFVVSLGSGNPEGCGLSWREIVNQQMKYFHPMGGNGWPKEPPNYIAFRYFGRLQSIHHIEGYTVTKNLHDELIQMPDKEDCAYFVYNLGPAIIPSKEVKTGTIYRNGRVWCHLDLLLTCDTISEARDITQQRK